MSQQLISRNPDLKRLRDEGFEVEVRANHLLIHSIPYATRQRTVARGMLVSTLELIADATITPSQHVVYFIGEHPSAYRHTKERGSRKRRPSEVADCARRTALSMTV